MKTLLFLIVVSIGIFNTGDAPNKLKLLEGSDIGECISDNMLEFSSMTEFTNTTAQLKSEGEGATESRSRSSSFPAKFTSQASYLENLENQSEGDPVLITDDDELNDPYLSSIVNIEGEVKIENVIYKFANDYVYAYLGCDGKNQIASFLSEIENGRIALSEGESMIYSPQLFVFKVETIEKPITVRRSETDTYNYESRRRVKGKMWETNYYVHKSNGVKTKMQRKKFGIWVGTKADEITVSWDCTFYNTTLNGPTSEEACNLAWEPPFVAYQNETDSKTKTNASKVKVVFDSSTGGGVTTSGGTITGGQQVQGLLFKFVKHSQYRNTLSNHSATKDNNQYSTCTLHWKACEGTVEPCEGGLTTTSGNSGTGANPCNPPCVAPAYCAAGQCVEIGSTNCMPKCPPGEQCHNGVCIPM